MTASNWGWRLLQCRRVRLPVEHMRSMSYFANGPAVPQMWVTSCSLGHHTDMQSEQSVTGALILQEGGFPSIPLSIISVCVENEIWSRAEMQMNVWGGRLAEKDSLNILVSTRVQSFKTLLQRRPGTFGARSPSSEEFIVSFSSAANETTWVERLSNH